MHRLYQLLFLTAACLTARSVPAQSMQHQYTIAGDVAVAQTYQWPAEESIHLEDLIRQAGVHDPVGAAVIVKLPDLQTHSVAVNPAIGRSPRLENGDIVIFRSPDGGSPVSSAVVMLNRFPSIVPFRGRSVALSSVIQRLGVPVNPSAAALRTDGVSSSHLRMTAHDHIQHGDVILLTTADSNSPAMTQQLPSPPAHDPLHSDTDNAPASPLDEDRIERALSIPGMFAEKEDDDVSNETQLTEPADPVTVPHHPSRPPVIRSASLETTDPLEQAIIDNIDPEDSKDAETAGRSGIWNMIFAGGLICAAGLIVFGWIRTRQEQKLNATVNNQLTDSLGQHDTATHTQEQQTSSPEDSSDQTATLPAADSIVQPSPEVVSEVNGDCPILSAGMPAQTSEDPNPRGDTEATPDVAAAPSNAASIDADSEPESTTPQVMTDDWFDHDEPDEPSEICDPTEVVAADSGEAETFTDDANAAATPVLAEETTEINSANIIEAVDHKTTDRLPDASQTWGDLEDLIRNRLPVERQRLSLPAHVTLFGTPAGPRKIRIDAAHPSVPAPHITEAASRSPRSRTATPRAAAKPRQTTSHGSTSAPSDGLSSRFDQALNYLEEQSGT